MNAVSDVAQTIQLAIAPVFMLAGIGALLNVVTARLHRAVDRARTLEERLFAGETSLDADHVRDDLRVLDRRITLAQHAIIWCVISALLVCLLIALIFISDLLSLTSTGLVAVLFIVVMCLLIVGLSFFVAEITLATRQLRVRSEFLARK